MLLNQEQLDDEIWIEAYDTFIGGQLSFARARQVGETQAKQILNHVISIDGELRCRHGIASLGGDGTIGTAAAIVQAIIWYDRVASDKLVAFSQGNAFEWNGSAWVAYFTAAVSDVTDRIDLVQLTDNLYWADGGAAGVRKFDGTTVTTIGTSPVATILEVHANRLVASGVATVPDAVYFSDILDPSTWDMTNACLRIGSGGGEPVVGLKTWLDTGVLVFKRNSVWLIDANPLSSVANFAIKRVHGTVGCVARNSICQIGQDIWFLSRTGVQSVQRQMATSDTQITIPMSQPVQDIIQNIRWDHAHKSYGICYNNYYILAIPVDADEPDTVLVFHYLTGGWTVFTGWTPSCFYEQPFEGVTRLLIGEQGGDVVAWKDYLTDSEVVASDFTDKGVAISTTLEGRAFIFQAPLNFKSAFYGELDVFTQDVTFSIYIILDGEDPIFVRTYTLGIASVTLPVTIPFTLSAGGRWTTKRFPLNIPSITKAREFQIKIVSTSGRFIMRRLVMSAFLDTIALEEQ